jgi:hypothetical protein
MRMISRGIAPQAFNRAQRAERANQQRAGNDGMKDLGDAYTRKKKSSASKPMKDDDADDKSK